jgi:hypothetical protein
MYVYMYYLCTYVCMLCIYVCMYICMYVCMYVCMYAMYVLYMYVMYVCIYVCYVYMYVCMCVYMYVHACSPILTIKSLDLFYETWFQRSVTEGHSNVAFYNFIQLLITTWKTDKHVCWHWDCHYSAITSPYTHKWYRLFVCRPMAYRFQNHHLKPSGCVRLLYIHSNPFLEKFNYLWQALLLYFTATTRQTKFYRN